MGHLFFKLPFQVLFIYISPVGFQEFLLYFRMIIGPCWFWTSQQSLPILCVSVKSVIGVHCWIESLNFGIIKFITFSCFILLKFWEEKSFPTPVMIILLPFFSIIFITFGREPVLFFSIEWAGFPTTPPIKRQVIRPTYFLQIRCTDMKRNSIWEN